MTDRKTVLDENYNTSTTAITHKHVKSSPPGKSYITDTPAAAVFSPLDESFIWDTPGPISPFSDRQLAKDAPDVELYQNLNSSCAVSLSPGKTLTINNIESSPSSRDHFPPDE